MGWNRQKITDWMAMAGAVSALVYPSLREVQLMNLIKGSTSNESY